MKKFNILAATLAVLLVLGAGIGSAMAYFTTYVRAEGGMVIHLGDREEITEEFSNWTKHVVITSDQESQPVYIRARGYAGVQYTLTYTSEDDSWTEINPWTNEKDGWWYYKEIVPGGGNTSQLNVKIENIPKNAKEGDSFNVAVVYESTLVRYDAEGNPYANWDETLDAEVNGGE